MMRKLLMLLISTIIIFTGKIFAQTSIAADPATASFQNYVNASVSPATGIPSISIPLFSLASADSSMPVSLSLTYHPSNAKGYIPSGEIGSGWSMFKGASIGKENYSRANEFTEIDNLNKFNADRFYYGIPGHSGKFQIYRDSLTNNLKVFELSGNKVKIEFTRDTSSTKLIVNSFTITDDKGYQYFFEDYNISSFKEPFQLLRNHRTTYHISKIKDANNRELITYEYVVKTKDWAYNTSYLDYRRCRLSSITTPKGKIKFGYIENGSDDDLFLINEMQLFSANNTLIEKFKFGHANTPAMITADPSLPLAKGYSNKLSYLQKFDGNNNMVESTSFTYRTESFSAEPTGHVCSATAPDADPGLYMTGLLESIKFPTGGSVYYEFEPNEIYEDKSALDYSSATTLTDHSNQYFERTQQLNFDTNNTRDYTFAVSGNSGVSYPVIISRNLEEGTDYGVMQQGMPVEFKFSVVNSNNFTINASPCPIDPSYKYYSLTPGIYTIKINNWGGNGKMTIDELKYKPGPYRNSSLAQASGRIKKITYYDSDNTVQKQKKYEYNHFADPNDSSGYLFHDENMEFGQDYEGFVLYKNVRETEISDTQNNGHTDYYFNNPHDYGTDPILSGASHYNLTSKGILTKKNILNSQNQIQETNEYSYNFQEIPGAVSTNGGFFTYVPSFISQSTERVTVKRGSTDFVTVSEATYSPINFQQTSSKITTHNGDIQESTTKYAQDLSETRLVNANMISIPLETTVKENGIILSTSKTLFADAGHFYPTSVVVTDLAQVPETQMTFDVYDDRGNLVQITDKAGISTTTVWGYHKTLPIAQIAGAKYSDISSLPVIAAAVAASDADADSGSNEAALLTALDNLRLNSALQQYPVTVYTYDPLIGVTNSISGNGIKVSYTYDASGRLSTVKDSNGKVLKENQYNYKH